MIFIQNGLNMFADGVAEVLIKRALNAIEWTQVDEPDTMVRDGSYLGPYMWIGCYKGYFMFQIRMATNTKAEERNETKEGYLTSACFMKHRTTSRSLSEAKRKAAVTFLSNLNIIKDYMINNKESAYRSGRLDA